MAQHREPRFGNDFDKGFGAASEGPAHFRSALGSVDTAASADRVNRTHRVVRERAKNLAARKAKIRSLWLPVVLFSSLLAAICIAVWSVLDEYEVVAAGSQVASYQVLVPLLWSIPVSAALLAVVWFRQTRTDAGRGPVE
jgi:hypothetical protein